MKLNFETIAADLSRDASTFVSMTGKVMHWSMGATRLFGYSSDETMGRPIEDLIVPSNGVDEDRNWRREICNRGEMTFEALRRRKNGSLIYVNVTGRITRERSSEPLIFLSEKDITALKVNRDIRLMESRYGELLDSMPDGTVIVSPTGHIVFANNQIERLFGFVRRELHGVMLDRLLPERYQSAHIRYVANYFQNPRPRAMGAGLDLYGRRADGTEFPLEIGLSPLPGQDSTLTMAAIRDVTERKKADKKFRDLVESAPDAIVLMDTKGDIVLANSQAERLFGSKRSELIGKPIEVLLPKRFRRDHAGYRTRFFSEPRMRAMGAGVELFGLRADGTEFPVEISLSPLETEDGMLASAAVRDISERRAAQRVLEAAKAEAEAANIAKSQFLATMSHEIRTPMNGIIGFANLILSGPLTGAQRRYATLLKDASRSLLTIINDVLDVSKIEAGKLELEMIPISPSEVAGNVLSITRPQAEMKDLRMDLSVDPNVPPWIQGDPTRLSQILLNLATNAIKFTVEGSIQLHVARKGESLLFEVTDTGLGIPANRQHLLFQTFSQIDRTIARKYGGTGLGLAICKRLAEAMGGTIGVSSQVGTGSTFWFTIGLVEADAPSTLNLIFDACEVRDSRPLRVLVAEDIDMNQLVITGLLERMGHNVTIVENGVEAVSSVQRGEYDIVLMDMQMPELDGVAATRMVRDLGGHFRDIPIVALTANATSEDISLCTAAGMNDFLSKPIDATALSAIMNKWSGLIAGRAAPAAVEKCVVLDAEALDDMEETLGRKQVERFAKLFRDRVHGFIRQLALHADDLDLRQQTHNLVAIAGQLGCMEFLQAARRLSDALKRNSPDVDQLTAGIAEVAERAVAAIVQRYDLEVQGGDPEARPGDMPEDHLADLPAKD